MFSLEDKQLMLEVSRKSIEHGMIQDKAFAPEQDAYPEQLWIERASFVTLKVDEKLRGCIGNLSPISPLIVSISENAYSAAFRDPRFPRLTTEEYNQSRISISVLSEPTAIPFSSEDELLAALSIGSDGLIIRKGLCQATFLPAVWETVRNAQEFLLHLKHKAGIALDEMPESAWRYQTESFTEED